MIKPKYLNNKEYIINNLRKKEGKCIEEGFIKTINNINKIKFYKFYEQNFSGSILLEVEFNVDIITLDINEEIECKIIKSSEDGIVAQGEYPIFIIIDGDYENLDFLRVDDIINVKILQYEISIDRNIIKAVGKYISNKEYKINENNKDE